MSLSVKTNLYNEYTQNEIQVPESNYNLTGANLKLRIQRLVVKAESFNALALSQKVPGKGKVGKMLAQISFIIALKCLP